MPTLSQNAVRPDNPKSDSPLGHGDSLEHGKAHRKDHETPSRHSSLKSSLPSIQTSLGPRVNHSHSNTSPSFLPSPPMSSSPSNNSTMSHIRRWTSGLSTSSKKNDTKPPSKPRTIGPISAPQPLTTPVPYACTPLPYSDNTLTTPITPPRSPSISKPATSCPDLPSSSKKVETPSAPEQLSGGSFGRNQKLGWKNRLFNNSSTATKKPDNRRASTNSTVEDEYEWTEKDGDKDVNNDANSTSISVIETTSTGEVTSPSPRTSGRPKARISPPVSRPTFPPTSNQMKPVISVPWMSPTDDIFGPDSFDPFRVVHKTTSHIPPVVTLTYTPPTRSVAGTLSDPESATTSSSIAPTRPPRVRYPSAASTFSEIFKLSSSVDSDPRDTNWKDRDDESESGSEVDEDEEEDKEEGVLDFAATLCKGLGSDFVMPPSYFDQHNLSLDFNESYPHKRSLRGQASAEERASKSLSNCSLDSVSSAASTDSDSDSDSDSSSPISGASFFSTPPNPMPALSTTLSTALLKSGGIKIPSSLMTLLPSSKDKTSSSTTPPVTPPLEHVEAIARNMTILGQPASGLMPMADPRATTLKRLAYIHTLRKLRERERRPFRHAVLLHLILLQLRRGVTNKHCAEIAEFYTTMSVAQFPPRLDLANAITQQANQTTEVIPPTSESVPTVPNRTSSKVASLVINTSKEAKPRKSLVFSLQSRIQSKTQSDSNSNEASESTPERPRLTSIQPSKLPMPQPSLTFKDRLPLLRMPTYPLINLDKEKSFLASTSITSSAKSPASPQDSEDDEPSSPVESRSTPTIIIPKRTTGRKGVLYQQQLQLQLRQQMTTDPTFFMMRSSPQDRTAALDPVAAAWISAQLGARPSFASSTVTTIRTDRSELVTKPLVSPVIKVQPTVVPPERPRSMSPPPFAMNTPSYGPDLRMVYYGATPPPRASYFDSPAGPSPVASPTTGSFDQDMSDKNATPAGLLTPPLSPLFRPVFGPSYAPQSEATPLAQPRAYRALKRESAPPAFISSPAIMMMSTGPVSVPVSAGRNLTPMISVSSYTLPLVQNSHHTISYLEDQAMHARNVNNHRTASLGVLESRRPMSPPLSSASSISSSSSSTSSLSSSSSSSSSYGSSTTKVEYMAALPSPPLSPIMESEPLLPSLASPSDAKQGHKSAPLMRQSSFKHEHHAHQASNGYAKSQQQSHQVARVMSGGKSDNIPWIHGIKKKAEKEEEEDVPLALVQRRLSSDLLRSM
ncbi:hypothetical protein BGZ59_007052 [Podila verticillata]|nr:hypothetical protein BGZ59_007052 [Podila verticillata]KFH71469.1 hypothetical protein MVEG_01768 [Podila verticillata NRRL 6337]